MQAVTAEMIERMRSEIRECSVAEAHAAEASGALLVDVRETAEFRQGTIPGAALIPLSSFDASAATAIDAANADSDRNRAVIIYCASGVRSIVAAKALQDMGFTNVASMAGGIIAWAQQRLPIALPD